MHRRKSGRYGWGWLWSAGCLLGVGLALTGCAGTPTTDADSGLSGANQAYRARDYAGAYRRAKAVADEGTSAQAATAAYVAGMSARQLGDARQAERYLRQAVETDDRTLAGHAYAELGLLYLSQGRHDDAEAALLLAAARLSGQDQANAYYYAATAEQKLGKWETARANLLRARSLSRDARFQQQCQEALTAAGYTIQTGAYVSLKNAQTAAQGLQAAATAQGLPAPRVFAATDASGQTLYLVQLGRFPSYETALAIKQKLGLTSAILVPVSK